MKNRLFSFVILFVFFISLPVARAQEHPSRNAAKYVFLFIGDGMGLAQVNAAEAFSASVTGDNIAGGLAMTGMPVTGFVQTTAENRYITGSAAAGTALATGFKTSINTVGMNADRTQSLKSIAKVARENGLKVGILTNVSINHATPAAFYASRPDRNDYYEIAMQLPESGFDLFGYGGLKHQTGKNSDQPDALGFAQQKGYTLVEGKKAFMGLQQLPGKIIVMNARLDAEDASVPFVIDQQGDDMLLSEVVTKSIELLYSPDGFFLMVEGGLIDWACHSNDAATTIREVLDFDKAIGKALEFQKRHPEETLVIVTADHETGGMSLGTALRKYDSDWKLLEHQKVSVNILKQDIAAFKKACQGSCQLEKLLPLITAKTGLGRQIPLTDFDKIQLQMAFRASMFNQMPFQGKESNYLLYGDEDPLAVTLVKMTGQKAGIGWTSWSHTGIPVPVWAQGRGQEMFGGYIDNTGIPARILQAMGLPSTK
jgi:alkaline phosphatase